MCCKHEIKFSTTVFSLNVVRINVKLPPLIFRGKSWEGEGTVLVQKKLDECHMGREQLIFFFARWRGGPSALGTSLQISWSLHVNVDDDKFVSNDIIQMTYQPIFWFPSLFFRRSLLVDDTSCIQTEVRRWESTSWRWSHSC